MRACLVTAVPVMIILLCGVAFAASPTSAPTSAPPTAREDHIATCSIHLATDPTVCDLQSDITLNNRPKDFVVEFSEAVDRASAESAFWRNIAYDISVSAVAPPPSTSSTLRITLAWENDRRLHVKIAHPQGRIVLYFVEARTRDRHRRASQDFNNMFAFNTGKPQTLKRYDFQGKLLAQYPIESEILNFHGVYEGGYAIAGRPYHFDDCVGEPLLLLELTGQGVVKHPIPEEGEAQWDPAGAGLFVRSAERLTAYTLQEVKRGKPGSVIHKLRPRYESDRYEELVGFKPSPDGRRIALLKAREVFSANTLFRLHPLTLLVLDREGKVLQTMDLPFAAAASGYNFCPVNVEWVGESELLVCPQLGDMGRGHVHRIDLARRTVREYAIEPMVAPLLDHRKMLTAIDTPDGSSGLNITDTATETYSDTANFTLGWRLGKALTAGRGRFIFGERADFAYSAEGKPAPRVSVPGYPGHDFPARGALAGADADSVWLAVEE